MAVKTLRDAEIQIDALKRQQNELIRELRDLKLTTSKSTSESKVNQTVSQEVDSILNADKNTVVHRLLHIFDRVKIKLLEITELIVENLTATNLTSTNGTITNLTTTNGVIPNLETDHIDIRSHWFPSHIHITNTASNDGFHVQNLGPDTYISQGVFFNGTFWEATNVESRVLRIGGPGIVMYFNGGNTIGAAVTLTTFYNFTTGGVFFPLVPHRVTEGGTGKTSFNVGWPILGNGSGALAHPASVFNGTVYVAATSGGPTTTPKTFINGVCTS